MAKKTTLNAANLATLGAERLSELALEMAQGNAAAKRRLKLELTAMHDASSLSVEVRKRLSTIARSKAFIHASKQPAMANDLELQLRTITDMIARADTAEAVDLIWQLIDLAPGVQARTRDQKGLIAAVFERAIEALSDAIEKSDLQGSVITDRLMSAIKRYDQASLAALASAVLPHLGEEAATQLKVDMQAWIDEKGAVSAKAQRSQRVSRILRMLADHGGDVDAFMAQYGPKARQLPQVAIEIGKRLLKAGRIDEAHRILEGAKANQASHWLLEWEQLRIQALLELGRIDEAQELRLESFRTNLFDSHLRDYLKKLPDFDDIEAEKQLLAEIVYYPKALPALAFLIRWKALDHAARLVFEQMRSFDGLAFDILSPAAEALAGKHPMAATILLRSMISQSLQERKRFRYGHVAEHLRTCGILAEHIDDWGGIADHEGYVMALQNRYAAERSFWTKVYQG